VKGEANLSESSGEEKKAILVLLISIFLGRLQLWLNI